MLETSGNVQMFTRPTPPSSWGKEGWGCGVSMIACIFFNAISDSTTNHLPVSFSLATLSLTEAPLKVWFWSFRGPFQKHCTDLLWFCFLHKTSKKPIFRVSWPLSFEPICSTTEVFHCIPNKHRFYRWLKLQNTDTDLPVGNLDRYPSLLPACARWHRGPDTGP